MADLLETVFFHADVEPDRPAVIMDGSILTYGVLRRGVLSVQQRLKRAGLKPGDHVAICVDSAIGHVTLICALYRAGITSVSIELAQLEFADDLVFDALLTNFSQAKSLPRTLWIDNAWFEDRESDGSLPNMALTTPETNPCRLVLSSGTTGRPKIIAFSFAAVNERLVSYAIRVSTPSWTTLVCIPGLATNYGFSFMITTLWLGRTICLIQESTPRQAILAHQAEVLVASTHQISEMVQYQEQAFHRLESLRSVHIGGAIAYTPLLARIRMLIANNVYCGYGSTEGGTVAYAPAVSVFGMDRAVGVTAPWISAEVVDEARTRQPFGEAGELRLRALGQGYRAEKVDPDSYDIDTSEWFYPGDQGIHFRNGMLIITGRLNEMINRGGTKIAPDTIEEEMKKHPAVGDAAAVGVLDDLGIEQIWVAVVSRDGSEFDIKAMFGYCREHMPLYVPDRIFQVRSIPRNQLGKVSRVPLTEHLQALEKDLALTLR